MTTKINISLPEKTLKEIEETAKSTGDTRSGFIKKAAEEYIARLREEDEKKRLQNQREKTVAHQDKIREEIGKYDAGKVLRRFRDSRK